MIYIGCTLKPVDNWTEVLPMPVAPSNYKDPAKIEAYIADRVAELANGKASTHAVSGSIAEAVILVKPEPALICANGVTLIEQLSELLEGTDVPVVSCGLPDRFVGYKIRRNLRLAAIDYISTGKSLPAQLYWIVDGIPGIKYGVDWWDPISVMFGSDEDIDSVCRRLKITADLSCAKGLAQFSKTVAEMIVGE